MEERKAADTTSVVTPVHDESTPLERREESQVYRIKVERPVNQKESFVQWSTKELNINRFDLLVMVLGFRFDVSRCVFAEIILMCLVVTFHFLALSPSRPFSVYTCVSFVNHSL